MLRDIYASSTRFGLIFRRDQWVLIRDAVRGMNLAMNLPRMDDLIKEIKRIEDEFNQGYVLPAW